MEIINCAIDVAIISTEKHLLVRCGDGLIYDESQMIELP